MRSGGRVYVDMDDVLCQTALAFTEVLKREFGKDADFEQITTFDLSKSFNLTPEEHDAFMESAHHQEVLLSMEPMEGANDVLRMWIEDGYEIEIVTGRPPATEEVSARWLSEAGVPHHGLTFVDKYSRILPRWDGGSVRRLDEIEAEEFCLAVEDSWHVAEFLAQSLGLTVLLLDRPWNRFGDETATTGSGRVLRCRDWTEIAERFSALQGPGEA